MTAVILDITDARERDGELHGAMAVLKLFGTCSTRAEYLDRLIELVRDLADCDSAAIRLQGPDGTLRFAARSGLPDEIWREDRCLTATDSCACTRVARRTPAPAEQEAFTAGGSFRCDDLRAFSAASPGATYRSHCLAAFGSLAVIPIPYRGHVVGLLHLADRAPGGAPERRVRFLEAIAGFVGEAIHRYEAGEQLQRAHEAERLAARFRALRPGPSGLQRLAAEALETLPAISWPGELEGACLALA